MRTISAIKTLVRFLKKWLWKKPTEPVKKEPDHIRATDLNIKEAYVVIDYKGQKINLRSSEVAAFNAMSRKDKRAMANKFAKAETKGEIIFQEINGQLVAIKNKDYGQKNNIRQPHTDKTGRRK